MSAPEALAMGDDYIAEGVEPVTGQDAEDEAKPSRPIFQGRDECLAAESTLFFTKMYSARYLLAAIFGWLCWLVIALLLIDTLITGLRSICLAEYRRITNETICYDYRAPIDVKREELLSMSLQKRLFETHPQCLARAITKAHDHYDNIPYQSVEELVNETVSWAQGECDKLMFTPDAPPPTGWYWVWRAIADNTEMAVRQCKDALGNLYNRILSSDKKEREASSMPELGSLILPPGYRIECVGQNYSICELSCTSNSSLQIDDLSSPCNGTSHSTMRWFMSALAHIHAEIEKVKKLLPWLNCGAFVVSLVVIWDIMHMNHVDEGWKLHGTLATCFVVEIPFLQAHFWHQQVAEIDKFFTNMTTSNLKLHVLVAFVTVILLLVQWNFRSHVLPGPLSIWNELCAIYLGEPHGPTHQSSNEQTDDVLNNNDMVDGGGEENASDGPVPENQEDCSQRAGETTSDVSTPPIHRITPRTSFHEDVKNMREQLHWEQATSKLGLHPSLLQGAPPADSSAVGAPQNPVGGTQLTVVPEDSGDAAGAAGSTEAEAALDDMESF